MPATSGRASIAGFDVFDKSLEARSHLGYMPENVPLYTDMRVTEYLVYRAQLKGVTGRRLKERVGDVKELCGLKEVENRIINTLSKGFRQRVGLADALVHEPDLLILDEPTIGLDPNQIRSVRQLIRSLGGAHTVLISTHILPEVEMTCGRVLILHEGKILASDTLEKLMSGDGQIIVEMAAPQPVLQACFEQTGEIEYFDLVPVSGGYVRCSLTPSNGQDLRPQVFLLAKQQGWLIRELTHTHYSLEDIYLRLTKPDEEAEEEEDET